MSRSDSKIDLDKYKPSLEEARRIANEDAAQERLNKALDNPALDAALAEHGTVGKAQARVSKPSPWAKGGAPTSEAIDKTALPSATAPAAPPVTAPIKTHDRRRWSWPLWSKVLAPVALAFLPAIIVFLLFVKPQQPETKHDAPTMSAPAAATAPAPTAGPAAQPTASAAPPTSATATAVSSAAPMTSAPPSVTSVPSVAPGTTAPPPNVGPVGRKPRGAGEDPYSDSGAPPPPKTAAPLVPAPPPTTTSPPVAPQSPTSPPDPFMDKRPR